MIDVKYAPKHLYRYFTFDRVIQLFRTKSLYIPSPFDFNDPYDCGVGIRFPDFDLLCAEDRDNFKELSEFTVEILNSDPQRAGVKYAALPPNDPIYCDRQRYRDFCLRESESFRKCVLQRWSRIGVLCLTESPDFLPMWAHYAENHQGVVVRFDSHKFAENGEIRVFPVHYQEDFPSLKQVCSVLDDNLEYAKLFLCTKSSDWAPEKEWRLFAEEGPSPPGLEAVSGIIFGERMCRKQIDELDEIIGDTIQNDDKFCVCLSVNGFEVQIHPWRDWKDHSEI